MRLIGRANQLELLGTMLGQTLSGNGQVALVTGPVGAGKTELVHTFAEIASATGVRLGTATCTPSEQRLPLGVLSQLLPVSPTANPTLDPVELHDLARQITASDAPLLITVDDIQHADPLSLDCLFYVARRISSVRVMLLLVEADGPTTPVHTPLVREHHCHRVRVGCFDVPSTALLAGARAVEVHQLTAGNPLLVHAVLDAASLREDLLACVHRSHPSVLQVALSLAVLGPSSGDLVSQLSGLDPAAVPRVLSTMSEAGLVSAGCFRHPSAAGYLLDSLPRHERGDLHLRAARLLHDRGSPASSVAPHLAAADRPLAAWAAPVLQEAAEQALLDGSADVAARYLELAARTAVDDSCRASVRARLASVEWHDCPVRAFRHVPALLAASRSRLLDPQQEMSLARLLLWHGRTSEASAVLAELPWTEPLRSWLFCHLPGHAALASHAPPTDARAMATHHTHDTRRVPPISILGSGSDNAGTPADPPPSTEPPTRAMATHHTHDTRRVPPISILGSGSDNAGTPADPPPSTEPPTRAMATHHTHDTRRVPPISILGSGSDNAGTPADPPPSTEPPTRAMATHHTHDTRRVPPISILESGSDIAGAPTGWPTTTEPWARATTTLASVLKGSRDTTTAEELLQGASTHGVNDYRITALLALTYADALDTAAHWCDQLLQSAQRSTTLRAMLNAIRAEISLRTGDLTTASSQSAAALTTLSRQAWGIAIGFPLSTALLAATRRGDDPAAQKLAEIPTPPAMHQTRAGIHYAHARGHHHLANNRNHAALSDFLTIGETLANWQMDDIVQWRAGAAEAWLNQGNKAKAKDLVNDPRNGHELRLLAACEEKRKRPGLLTEAAEALQDRYELARTLHDLSRAWQATGEHRRARMTQRRAWHVATRTGATPLLPPDTDANTLSDAERKVAKLAAQGHTNREIADKLFITASTVEQHLTRVYRKLNVKYRTDLPADVAG
ncbi:LuxR C-terminal-related transcriptional regulator [Lentzea alba]|uniref:LuxR C-terminal-related transcriptional regulator n=1 Tax=Lentzea alba TaxID=2714351 RepID=UPI0039BFFC0B